MSCTSWPAEGEDINSREKEYISKATGRYSLGYPSFPAQPCSRSSRLPNARLPTKRSRLPYSVAFPYRHTQQPFRP